LPNSIKKYRIIPPSTREEKKENGEKITDTSLMLSCYLTIFWFSFNGRFQKSFRLG
jgi:hypothetical protein